MIKNIPDSKNALVIVGTEIEADQLTHLKKGITRLYEMGFSAHVSFLETPEMFGVEPSHFKDFKKGNYGFQFVFLIDKLTISSVENTIVCIDLDENPGTFFRVIPSEIWSVENNLLISNMYFEEFKESCNSDNVFRGFE